jgi:hypothetical protein
MPVASLKAVVIDPTAIYDDDSATVVLRISSAALAKARRDGSLRYSVRGGRNFYRGDWLLAWIESGEVRKAEMTQPGA